MNTANNNIIPPVPTVIQILISFFIGEIVGGVAVKTDIILVVDGVENEEDREENTVIEKTLIDIVDPYEEEVIIFLTDEVGVIAKYDCRIEELVPTVVVKVV